MAWLLLIGAGILEIGWPLGFKLASTYEKYFYLFITVSIISMGTSGFLLYLAQKTIPIGTAYVIWTGIGVVGTVLIGIFFFHDSANIFRLLFVLLILIGVVGLKVVHYTNLFTIRRFTIYDWNCLLPNFKGPHFVPYVLLSGTRSTRGGYKKTVVFI